MIQKDTDSNYMPVSERLEDIARPELRSEFEAKNKAWLAWDKLKLSTVFTTRPEPDKEASTMGLKVMPRQPLK